ncbi:MAG TPA: hypothetical protein VJ866_16050 [Pyrinomonadaceae bacterium]|nr:hypothetical protein [Pyrinomonadaceae bacterium]
MTRRALWETLVELIEAARPDEGAALPLRVTSLYLDVPLEVALHAAGDELELLGNLPRWRWTTAFDNRQARLQIDFRERGLT